MSTVEDAPIEEKAPRKLALTRPARGRTRPMMVGIAIALIVVGGLATMWLVQAMTTTTSVLTVSTAVDRGDAVGRDDLTSIQIAGGQNVDAFTVEQQAELEGKTALVDLPEGTLLTSANVGDELAVPAGSSLVGVSLTGAQLPGHELAAGDSVRVVDTPVAQGDPPEGTPESFEATVFTTTYLSETQITVVDLIVPQDAAADIAARAASGRVALILDESAGE